MSRVWILVLSFSFCTSSYGQNNAMQPEPVDQETEKISEIRQYLKPFDYDPENLRDPFQPLVEDAPLIPGPIYGPFLEIQTFNLGDFRLKGLVWDSTNPVAIFSAPNGADYKLRKNDYIGENFGYIAKIREKQVVVIQTMEEDGKKFSVTKVVFLE